MCDTETMDETVREIAHGAIALIDRTIDANLDATATSQRVAREALAHLARLLEIQLSSPDIDYEVVALSARTAMETWLTGHASLLLGEKRDQRIDGHTSWEDLARSLDDEMYGPSERPKAFRRHLHSFFDEVDIASPTPVDRPIDFVRVGLWVTLFLAHDYFAAIGEPATAHEARALFDRLRSATDDFYLSRSTSAGS
jgi:hypothetical protein